SGTSATPELFSSSPSNGFCDPGAATTTGSALHCSGQASSPPLVIARGCEAPACTPQRSVCNDRYSGLPPMNRLCSSEFAGIGGLECFSEQRDPEEGLGREDRRRGQRPEEDPERGQVREPRKKVDEQA